MGYLQDIDTLTHKCPNTTRDLSGLTAFKALHALKFHFLDYATSNFKAVLQGVRHRLTDLKLSRGEGVDLQDIITLCPSLANLCLIKYSISSLNSNTPILNESTPFRNQIMCVLFIILYCTTCFGL
jgi:hypothetical protein